MSLKTTVRRYHELLGNAWPAKTIIVQNGWMIRLSEGVTRRANSVLPLQYNGDNILDDINLVEQIYQEHNLPIVFQIPDYCEPPHLKKTLCSSGYNSVDETFVMTSPISDIVPIKTAQRLHTAIEPMLAESWLTAFRNLTQHTQTTVQGHRQIISRIPISAKAFCTGMLDGIIVAVGLAVLERQHVGIYDLVIHPDYRRQGIAQSFLARIVQWGKEHSAETVYLTVQGDNVGAIKLYKKIGLKDRYHYRYLVKSARVKV